jgi:RimJ/RimL family protein N-acetyltransferase
MITLRKILESDKEEMVKLLNNENVSRFTSDRIPFPCSISDANKFYEVVKSSNDLFFAIDLNGKIIGTLGLHHQLLPNNAHNLEIGYWIGEPYWGKGYGREVVKLGLDAAFSQPGICRVFARVFQGNAASEKILLKNGFELEGELKQHIFKRGKFLNERVFGKIKPQ